MKNIKIEQLPSGSYRIRKTYRKKTYTVITDYKPTQKEAITLLAEKMNLPGYAAHKSRTFEEAAREYISDKDKVLSPSTLRSYDTILRMLPDDITHARITDITADEIQRYINDLSQKKSPKTVRNYHGFISAVLSSYRPDMILKTRLPQKEKYEAYVPTPDEARQVMDAVAGTMYEVAFTLGAYGLRRSEIIALTLDDVADGRIRVNKAIVKGPDGWTEKTTKTTASTRSVPMPPSVVEIIQRQGYIYKGDPNSIVRRLHHIQDDLGIPRFRLHDMRHFFATELHRAGFSDADICELGGWSDSANVMRSVYRHARIQDDKDAQRAAADKIDGLLKGN